MDFLLIISRNCSWSSVCSILHTSVQHYKICLHFRKHQWIQPHAAHKSSGL